MRSLHSDPEEDITIEFSHHSSESLENAYVSMMSHDHLQTSSAISNGVTYDIC